MTLSDHTPSRRTVLMGLSALALAPAMPAAALSTSEANALIEQVSSEVLAIVNGGGPTSQVLSKFEAMFNRYADVTFIGRAVIGAPWRSASQSEQQAFIAAFRGYLSRKYGKQFGDYKGASVKITKTQDGGNKGVLVTTQIKPKLNMTPR